MSQKDLQILTQQIIGRINRLDDALVALEKIVLRPFEEDLLEPIERGTTEHFNLQKEYERYATIMTSSINLAKQLLILKQKEEEESSYIADEAYHKLKAIPPEDFKTLMKIVNIRKQANEQKSKQADKEENTQVSDKEKNTQVDTKTEKQTDEQIKEQTTND